MGSLNLGEYTLDIDGNGDLAQYGGEGLHDHLKKNGNIFFLIKKKQARVFKKQAERIIKSENLLKNRRGLWSRLTSFLYLLYSSVFGYTLSTINKELDRPLLVYTTCWRYVISIGGEDLPDGMAKIIFFGGILKPTTSNSNNS